jgi:hypothetical protein
VLTDLRSDEKRIAQVRELSRWKFTAEERWRRYFVILNDGDEAPAMHSPYWVPQSEILNRIGREREPRFLDPGIFMPRSLDAKQAVTLLRERERIKSERLAREQSIQRLERELRERKHASDAQYEAELSRLFRKTSTRIS